MITGVGCMAGGGAGKSHAASLLDRAGEHRILSGMGPRRVHTALWLIDDTAEHHATVVETLGCFPAVSFRGFLDAHEAITEFTFLCHREPPHLPDIVLMDFFLGDLRGDIVTQALRRVQPHAVSVTIIGYSSVASGSERILQAGGDLIIRKVRDGTGRNPLLDRFLRDRLGGDSQKPR